MLTASFIRNPVPSPLPVQIHRNASFECLRLVHPIHKAYVSVFDMENETKNGNLNVITL